MNVQRSPRRDAPGIAEQDRLVVAYTHDGMPLNAAGRIVLTPMMRLEGYYVMGNGFIGRKSRRNHALGRRGVATR